MKKKFQFPNSNFQTYGKYIIGLFLILLFGLVIFQQYSSSLFFQKKDRVNVVFYGKNTVYYSLGKYDGVHYFISFYPDVKVKVPGGYGNYRVGGLGKLVVLEKKSDLFRKTFSVTTASTVDRYFYTASTDIYYGKEEMDEDSLSFPSFKDIFFSTSNSNVFDRTFVFFQFLGKRVRQFSEIDYKSLLGTDEEFFQDKDFAKKYQGFLYNRIYRKEKKTVQIQYEKSYKTALFISKIIEGDGIRTVDLSDTNFIKGTCEVIEDAETFSQTAKDISGFFGCNLKRGSPASSDILMKLGSVEKEWEIL
ncbi:hypothetical protein HZC27_01420 [Candidatus Roizmanbacteria bacterium]|nr:hypothetical protein [Candidatus Roizmanbacteria bacterium]